MTAANTAKLFSRNRLDHCQINRTGTPSLDYDPDESNLLVAAFAVATSFELLVAIKAQLEKHDNNALRAIDPAVERYVEGWQAVIDAGLRGQSCLLMEIIYGTVRKGGAPIFR